MHKYFLEVCYSLLSECLSFCFLCFQCWLCFQWHKQVRWGLYQIEYFNTKPVAFTSYTIAVLFFLFFYTLILSLSPNSLHFSSHCGLWQKLCLCTMGWCKLSSGSIPTPPRWLSSDPGFSKSSRVWGSVLCWIFDL